MTKVLIAGELADGRPTAPTAQLMTAAKVALTAEDIAVAFLGEGFGKSEAAISQAPANRVYLASHPALVNGGAGEFEAPVDVLAAMVKEIAPDVVLLAKTDFGANVGARLGFRLGLPVAQDCSNVARDCAGTVVVTRPVYGGAAVAEFEMPQGMAAIVILRVGAYEASPLSGGNPEVVMFDPSPHVRSRRVKLLETVAERQTGIRLEDARVVVSGGRGLGGPAPFKQLEELAGLLGGAVGASRAACDAGWIDHSHQVGLTGKSVSPQLYIAIGISGASQHMAGCSGSGAIVAINKDRESNIFKEARFGVTGDWQRVLPAFIATVRDLGKA